ncbi:hypothetical protein E2562_009700 [Oryza meyeriana var. granulata]|uniref:Uncharacterized protein n=1 Tax=Oryza meyeriana var. granulata TaxID=110450 RepID=A0A6G1D0V9_9ORYZ|nr:hypothetical protein E2562_009700 [Oryza meyeriana var. granulata]
MRVLEFCKACVEQERAGSLYACGCPGTGKTPSMNKVKESVARWADDMGMETPDALSINCTSLANTNEIFSKESKNVQYAAGKEKQTMESKECLDKVAKTVAESELDVLEPGGHGDWHGEACSTWRKTWGPSANGGEGGGAHTKAECAAWRDSEVLA